MMSAAPASSSSVVVVVVVVVVALRVLPQLRLLARRRPMDRALHVRDAKVLRRTGT
jgi:hypothetical protein